MLGDPTRLSIVELLIERPRIQKDLVAAVGLSQGQVSSHLSCLVWCGLVDATRLGQAGTMREQRPWGGPCDLIRACTNRCGPPQSCPQTARHLDIRDSLWSTHKCRYVRPESRKLVPLVAGSSESTTTRDRVL